MTFLFSQTKKDVQVLIDSCAKQADALNYSEAILSGKKAVELSQKVKDKELMYASNYELGRVYYLNARFSEANTNYFKALLFAEKLNEQLKKGECLHAIGIVYYAMNEPEKSFEYFRKSLALCTEKQFDILRSKNYSYLASLFYNAGISDSSLYYYEITISFPLLEFRQRKIYRQSYYK